MSCERKIVHPKVIGLHQISEPLKLLHHSSDVGSRNFFGCSESERELIMRSRRSLSEISSHGSSSKKGSKLSTDVILFPFEQQQPELIINQEKQSVNLSKVGPPYIQQNSLSEEKQIQLIECAAQISVSVPAHQSELETNAFDGQAKNIINDIREAKDISKVAQTVEKGTNIHLPDKISSDVIGEWSGGVQIRRDRRRKRKTRQTSNGPPLEHPAHERYAVLFDAGEDFAMLAEISTNHYGANAAPPLPKRDYPSAGRKSTAGLDVFAQEMNMIRAPDEEENDDILLADLEQFDREAEGRFLDEQGGVFLMDENFLAMFGNRHLTEDLGEMGAVRRAMPTYPVGVPKYTECQICFLSTDLNLRPCCSFAVCGACLRTYFETKVSMAVVKIQCIGADCVCSVPRDEIHAILDAPHRVKFNQFLVDANREPHRKTCPRCSHILTVDIQLLKNPIVHKSGYRVECAECALVWCFPCQAPWHAPIKCKAYQQGDRLLKTWAREQHFGQANAQKCPKCKVYIQRSSGCDHMTCSRCKANFCYRCGEQFRELKFIGNHYSKLSIFGCKYRYKPNNPVQRKIIRGSIFGGKLLAAPVLGGLAIGAGAIVLGVGAVVLPIYGAYRLHLKLQQQKRAKRERKAREEMWKKMEEMQKRGEELDISSPISNSDIVAEIEASQRDADWLADTGSASVFSSGSEDNSTFMVFDVERSSSFDSDSQAGPYAASRQGVQDKSCQTSHACGIATQSGVTSEKIPFHRRGSSRHFRCNFDTLSLPPETDLRFEPRRVPSPAFFRFSRREAGTMGGAEKERAMTGEYEERKHPSQLKDRAYHETTIDGYEDGDTSSICDQFSILRSSSFEESIHSFDLDRSNNDASPVIQRDADKCFLQERGNDLKSTAESDGNIINLVAKDPAKIDSDSQLISKNKADKETSGRFENKGDALERLDSTEVLYIPPADETSLQEIVSPAEGVSSLDTSVDTFCHVKEHSTAKEMSLSRLSGNESETHSKVSNPIKYHDGGVDEVEGAGEVCSHSSSGKYVLPCDFVIHL